MRSNYPRHGGLTPHPTPTLLSRRIKPKTLGQILDGFNPDVEVLILDVREEDDFEQCRVSNAVLYPARRFTHTSAPFSLQMLNFKVRPARVRIVSTLIPWISPPLTHRQNNVPYLSRVEL